MKRTTSTIRLLAVLMLAALVLGGCARKQTSTAPVPKPQGSLAVAGFTNPQFTWELLAGYLPSEGKSVDPKVLSRLDQQLVDTLRAHNVADFVPPTVTRQCQEIVVFEQGKTRASALRYWLSVGQCVPADLLLVPQLLEWRDRTADELGYKTPATVVIDFFLIDVKNQKVLGRYHFDETQQDLASNLLEAGKFFDRKGKWISAYELAGEGMEQGLMELGL